MTWYWMSGAFWIYEAVKGSAKGSRLHDHHDVRMRLLSQFCSCSKIRLMLSTAAVVHTARIMVMLLQSRKVRGPQIYPDSPKRAFLQRYCSTKSCVCLTLSHSKSSFVYISDSRFQPRSPTCRHVLSVVQSPGRKWKGQEGVSCLFSFFILLINNLVAPDQAPDSSIEPRF